MLGIAIAGAALVISRSLSLTQQETAGGTSSSKRVTDHDYARRASSESAGYAAAKAKQQQSAAAAAAKTATSQSALTVKENNAAFALFPYEKRSTSEAGVTGLDDPVLYVPVDVQGDSSTATVMGMATGYGLDVYQRFVGSLRKSGFKGNIILGVAPDVSPRVLAYFKYRGVTPKLLKWVNCTYQTDEADTGDIFKRTKCSYPYPDIKIRWSRFPLQRDWLEECETCTGPVLIMDVRDAYFQLDPFGPGSGKVTGLQVFEEHPSQTTGHWLVKPIVDKCKGSSFIKPMLCSGTTIGTRPAMIKYLEVMYGEMKVWINEPKCRFNLNGDDQTIHNYLYYTGQLPFASAIPNRQGIVNTVGVEGSIVFKAKRQKFMDAGMDQGEAGRHPFEGANGQTWIGPQYNVADEYGFFTQADGHTRSRVIHQFDRYGVSYLDWLRKQDFVKDKLPNGYELSRDELAQISQQQQHQSIVAEAPKLAAPQHHGTTSRRTTTDSGVDVSHPALYETIDLKGDSSTATVMGMATGYNLGIYQRFVGSLRKSGFKGNIILGVKPDVEEKILKYFEYRNVTPKILKWVECAYKTDENDKADIFKKTTCSDPYPDIKIRWSRFPLQRDWLQDCVTCTGPVLIMDVRDSYFQRDPFGPGSGPITGLQVFEEHPSQTTGHWLVKPIVEKCKGTSFIKPMLCSGTTIGTRAAMIKYLEAMYGEMKVWINEAKCRFNLNGDDQTIHNYLYYTGQLPFATAIRNREGIVNTVGVEGAQLWHAKRKRLEAEQGLTEQQAASVPYPGANANTWIGTEFNVTDAEGYFTQYDGERSRVVHQFDRYGRTMGGWLGRQDFVKDTMPN